MLQDAVEWGLMRENICERVKPPKVPKKESKFLDIGQARDLLKALDQEELKYKIMIVLAIFTGFRRSEIMGLEWPDINFEDHVVTINRTSNYTPQDGTFEDETKTRKSRRSVYVPNDVMALLQEYQAWWDEEKKKAKDKWMGSNRLFIQWNGAPMHPDTITHWLPKFINKYNLPEVTYHGLRHTHGSILLAMGMDLESVADQLGHDSVQMLVERYGHNVRRRSQEAAEHMSAALLRVESENEENEKVAE